MYREFSKRLEIMRITDRHTNYKVGRIGKVLGCVEFFFGRNAICPELARSTILPS